MALDAVQVALTAIMAISTLAYAVLTVILVRETRRLREVQAEPEIALYLQISEYIQFTFDIVVRNIGASTAYELKWEFERDHPLIVDRDVRLDRMRFFEGAASFAPGQEYRSFFGSSPDLLAEPIPPPLQMNVKYENRQGKEFRRTFEIDPAQQFGRSWVGGHPMRELATAIKNLQRDFRHVTTGFRKLSVDTFDREDREIQRERRQQHLDALREETAEGGAGSVGEQDEVNNGGE